MRLVVFRRSVCVTQDETYGKSLEEAHRGHDQPSTKDQRLRSCFAAGSGSFTRGRCVQGRNGPPR